MAELDELPLDPDELPLDPDELPPEDPPDPEPLLADDPLDPLLDDPDEPWCTDDDVPLSAAGSPMDTEHPLRYAVAVIAPMAIQSLRRTSNHPLFNSFA